MQRKTLRRNPAGEVQEQDEDENTTGVPPRATSSKSGGSKRGRGDQIAMTSIKVFRSFLRRNPDGTLDASRLTSTPCYNAWLASRKQDTQFPEKAFQRALTGHITGVDGRTPFNAEEERAILKTLRKKERWQCFEHSSTKFGQLGFRTRGYHERLAGGEDLPPSDDEDEEQGAASIVPPRGPKTTRKRSRKSKRTDEDDEDEDGLEDSSEEIVPRASATPQNHGDAASDDDHDDDPDYRAKKSRRQSKRAKRTGPKSYKGRSEDESSTLSMTSTSSSSNHHGAAAASQPIPAGTPFHPVTELGGRAGNVIYLVTASYNLIKKLKDFGQMWRVVHGFVRMRLLTRGWFSSPTMEQAERVMERIHEQYPGEYVIMFDFTTANHLHRIILQDDLAFQYFGGLSRAYGGFQGKRFLPEDTFKVFETIAQAYTYPGHAFPLRMRWILNASDADKQEEAPMKMAWFDVAYHVDEAHQLLIERGRPVPGESIDPILLASRSAKLLAANALSSQS